MTSLRIAAHSGRLALASYDEVARLLPHGKTDLVQFPCLSANDVAFQLSDLLRQQCADVAVVSAVDLPYPLAKDLEVVALLPAKSQTDSLVALRPLAQLPKNPRLGTLSNRQVDALLRCRPDADVVLLHGPVEEILLHGDGQQCDALVVPTCHLERLGLGRLASEVMPYECHPLQGHLAVIALKENGVEAERFRQFDVRKHWGEVIIAGFGPGDPGLITRKAEMWLSMADVIVYDDLVDNTFLRKYCAEKIYVGKRKGAHYSQQDEINSTLHHNAVLGKKVVRIKGGDPLLFGRGAEEYHFLSQRLVKTVIVPGVSSAMAAAASAIVPLTARGVSSSVAFLSAHNLDKLQVPKAETLVFFMGAVTQRDLAKKLVLEGWSASTPVAVVRHASTPEEETRRYTLEQLAVDSAPLESPVIIMVGNSAADNGGVPPKRWLFTGLNVADFKGDGICVHSPMIAIEPARLDRQAAQMLRHLNQFNRIVFTGRHTVEHFFGRLFELGLDARVLSGITVTCVGDATSKALLGKGILAPAVGVGDSSGALVDWFKGKAFSVEKILVPCSSLGLSVLPVGLQALGHRVETLAVYNTVMPDSIVRHDLDAFYGVVFTSPSTVDNFVRFYGHVPPHLKVMVRGAETKLKLSKRAEVAVCE